MEDKLCREDDLSSSSEGSEAIIQKMREEISSLKEEVNDLRSAKDDAELKLQLMRERYEEDMISLKDVRLETLIKNTGTKQYFDRLKSNDKIKDDLIQRLEEKAQQKDNELARLRTKISQLEKKNEDYLRRLAELEEERRHSRSSIIDNRRAISPPPPADMGNLFQELSMLNSQKSLHHSYNHTSDNNSLPTSPMMNEYTSFTDIPPPPDVEVDINLGDLGNDNK